MLKNPDLKAILVNIFGGIMRCDVIAEGVIAGSKAVNLNVPLVVRMKGTNETSARRCWPIRACRSSRRTAWKRLRRRSSRCRRQVSALNDRYGGAVCTRRQSNRGQNTCRFWINKDTKVITQGITGKTGQFHTRACREYANGREAFVAGVNPKKAGEDFEGIPIYASVKEAKAETGATVSVIYVPPAAQRLRSGKRSKPIWPRSASRKAFPSVT